MSEVAEKEERRYGVCSGNPRGTKEDPARCIAEVFPTGRGSGFASFVGQQCSRKRGHGPDGEHCSVHAKSTANIKPLREYKRY